MDFLPEFFIYNRYCAKANDEKGSLLFEKLSKQQKPKVLWIGCSDSCFPANQIVGLFTG